ncbi:hypothetical protein TSA1_05725 [Bradyrhizobium nitroreducens]|uniref:Uncharacterized protein n=1 Tax=Bradyrhizobium nitroreducens TaxID=709803 RepID=A0A2M6U6V8_9BRAD|nr:hypothetical protein [Bradyrhizobium nitroreducens]PIT00319.1 hypothetical protein TSA1_05725 [Bradyrhizobium nitroreducens]
MTSSSAHLVERVRELVAGGALADERVDALVLRGRLSSADAQTAWLGFADDVPSPFTSVQVYNPALGGDLLTGDVFDSAREIVITLGKPAAEGCAFFIFQSSIPQYLTRRTVLAQVAASDFNPAQAFRTRGLNVAPWNLELPAGPPEALPDAINPSRYVRDFVPDREVATDLNPWILVAAPAASSAAYQAWEAVAARRLLGGLVSRVWLEDGQVWLQAAATPPIYRIKADDHALPGARPQLTEAASWVFLSGTDIEARHLLFSGELARASRPQQDLATTLAQALEAAKAAYEAHVQSSSRETLKALADLRKTVIDETQKVAQRAQDLAATLWRDLAVSAAPFILKILGDATKTPGVLVSSLFYFAAAAFIGLSFVLQWRINASFFESQASSRRSWMQSLYSYISVREREEIAEAPIEQAMKNYRETRGVLLVVYALLIAALVAFGVHTLNDVTPSPSKPTATGETIPAQIQAPPSKPPP